MTCRNVFSVFAFLLAFSVGASCTWAQTPITVINPGGEAYTATPGNNVAIDPGGVAPIGTTGWNSTLTGTPGTDGAEAINQGNANSGVIRLAVGATNTSTNAAEDFVLFQETSHVVSAGDEFILNFHGRAFFQFDQGTDFQTSLFGYLDSGGNLVSVDTMQHPSTVINVWNPASHTFQVPTTGGSPIIGENLVIGFFTDTPGVGMGGFTSVDDVTLTLGLGCAPGDANCDTFINLADAQLIAMNFFETVTVGTMGDVTNDGFVDFEDFREWKDASGFGGGMAEAFALANAPEPSSLGLAGLGIALVLWKSRRRNRA